MRHDSVIHSFNAPTFRILGRSGVCIRDGLVPDRGATHIGIDPRFVWRRKDGEGGKVRYLIFLSGRLGAADGKEKSKDDMTRPVVSPANRFPSASAGPPRMKPTLHAKLSPHCPLNTHSQVKPTHPFRSSPLNHPSPSLVCRLLRASIQTGCFNLLGIVAVHSFESSPSLSIIASPFPA